MKLWYLFIILVNANGELEVTHYDDETFFVSSVCHETGYEMEEKYAHHGVETKGHICISDDQAQRLVDGETNFTLVVKDPHKE